MSIVGPHGQEAKSKNAAQPNLTANKKNIRMGMAGQVDECRYERIGNDGMDG